MYEFDENKSQSNLMKHGINFVEAQLIWKDPDYIEIQAKSENESRYLVIGLINKKHWSAIITYRGVKIRIISVRRSRILEVDLYES